MYQAFDSHTRKHQQQGPQVLRSHRLLDIKDITSNTMRGVDMSLLCPPSHSLVSMSLPSQSSGALDYKFSPRPHKDPGWPCGKFARSR
jgi:hypothetical protein